MQNQAIVALKGCVVNSCLRSSVTFLVMNRLLLCSAFSNRVATMLFHVINENLLKRWNVMVSNLLKFHMSLKIEQRFLAFC